ncbi:MAG: hypothetical protein ACT4NY_21375 [Pseudonocardiales bacterium]
MGDPAAEDYAREIIARLHGNRGLSEGRELRDAYEQMRRQNRPSR